MSWGAFERASGVISFVWTWISPVLVSFGPGKDWVQYFLPSLWPPKKVQPTQSDPESHELGERESRLLRDLQVITERAQANNSNFEAQRRAQEESLCVLSNELSTASTEYHRLVQTLEARQAELQRLEEDIRNRAAAVGNREVEVGNREAELEAKTRDHVLVPHCDIVEVFDVAVEVSRKVHSIRDGL